MSVLARQVVLTSRNGRRTTFRVRGLLRNAALAARLAAASADAIEIRLDTGSVRVLLSPERPEAFWFEWLSVTVEAQLGAAPPAPSPIVPGQRAAMRRLRPPKPSIAAGMAVATWTDATHSTPMPRLLEDLGDDGQIDLEKGLSSAQAEQRLTRNGPNEIRDITGRSTSEILLGQFRSVPVALLSGSAGLALATRAFVDAGAIGTVLAANAALGFVTERRAEETVSSLRKLGPRETTVLRDGVPVTINARDVVVGDVLVLRPGEPVAADARVIQAHRLATNEAALTGESLPVRKEPVACLPEDTPLGERRNMIFMGTVVSGGAGRAVVVATAEHAALGRIRQLAQGSEAPHTQLQQELDGLGRRLAIGAAALCVGVFAIGALRGRPLLPLLRTAVSLGVAAIPEGLPTVATSLLASSIRSLQQRQIYARRLDAIENLGAVDTVCFDKTGTLTQNRMSVASLTLGLDLIVLGDTPSPPALPEHWVRVAALCNTVERPNGDTAGAWQGSSTEVALLEFAAAQGADVDQLRRCHPTLGVRHRSEHHPYMVTLHASAERGLLVTVKGRPEEVLARCDAWFDGHRMRSLKPAQRRHLLQLNDRMAARGERVLALAIRQQPDQAYGETVGLSWLGLAGLADPLRPDLPQMVRRFKDAGIRPLMITGDQMGTAQAVADRIGLDGLQPIVDAAKLPESAALIADQAEHSSGFARTSPAMKLEIVRALQQRGHVVAMTGDGINDGPALKTADVGVAMGVTGTDFAHAMSDLVLRDDHPAAMLVAIEQGRTAFLNIKKSVRYLVATNLSELAATTIAVAAGLPDPYDPLALLWTNIATDIWPAIALGLEPAEPGILQRPPVSLRGGLLDRSEWGAVATDAGAMTLASLTSFGYGLARYGAGPQARTLAFMTLTSSQLLYALAMRSPRPLRSGGLQPNPMLGRAVGWTLAAQAGTVLLPFARRILRTTPIGPIDAVVVAATAMLPLLTRELLKEREQ
ncbi:cation-transporting P-type ATPase [Hydrogenophaga sp.]|uniref:cation-translocating P-type ATPase n=1 Tax=Hydrogenophaga sp. TaxID=1904254 RepID=UPI002613CFC4|nr:cation-transporting P-type ATPase [Hydrogenophaga sp.]MDM7950844.1 cation-transporting P-type ATPase [Hydrogenophaga sp.]